MTLLKTTGKPRVTVLLPIYNAENYLRESVDSLLAQSYSDFEIIAVNDGSTDASKNILQGINDPRLNILDNDGNKGIIFTLNRGIRAARGQYIARMDADDVAKPDRFAKQVDYLDSHPQVALVGTGAYLIDEKGRTFDEWDVQMESLDKTILRYCCFIHPTVMFRREAVAEIGGYRDIARHAEDYDLWLRLSEKYPLANIPESLLKYRVHAQQISLTKLDQQVAMANYCRLHSALRRKCYSTEAVARRAMIPSYWARLTGQESTTGAAYAHWIATYRKMNRKDVAARLCLPFIRSAPLSVRAYRELGTAVRESGFAKAMRWYATKLRNLLRK